MQFQQQINRENLKNKVEQLLLQLQTEFDYNDDDYKYQTHPKSSSNLPEPQIAESTTSNITVNTFPPYYPPNYNIINVNNGSNYKLRNRNSDKKEKKEENNVESKVIGTIIISGISFAAVWVFAKDGYLTLIRSGINNQIDTIRDLSLTSGDYPIVNSAIDSCKEWYNKRKQRTTNSFYSKVGLIGSGLALGSGIFFGAPVVIFGSVAGATASGCYMFWNHLTRSNTYLISEAHTFHQVKLQLEQILHQLNQTNHPVQYIPQDSNGPGSYNPNLYDQPSFYSSAPPVNE